MNWREFFCRLTDFEQRNYLDRRRFCLIAGGAMLIHGLRLETDDIDLKMTPEYFAVVKEQLEVERSPKFDYLWVTPKKVEIAVMEYRPEDVEYVRGFLVEKLERQLAWKKQHQRPKDARDIALIEEYLRQRRVQP